MTPLSKAWHVCKLTSYQYSIVTTSLSSTVSGIFCVTLWRDLESWVRGHSRLLKMVPFESLSTFSYLHSIVTTALAHIVSEIKRDTGYWWKVAIFTARCYAQRGLWRRKMSVRPSVTRRYSVETVTHILNFFTFRQPHYSRFFVPNGMAIFLSSDGNPLH